MIDLSRYVPHIVAVLFVVLGAWFALTGFLNAVLRLVPAEHRRRVEREYPRIAWAARAVRKAGADLVPFLLAAFNVLSGRPFPVPAPQAQESKRGEGGFVRGSTLLRLALACALAFVILPIVAALHGCGSQQRVAAGVIVSTGGAVSGMRTSNRDAYVRATDALRARVQGEQYARESEPLDAAFRARGRAIRDLTAVLYASARLNDTPNPTPAQIAAAARDILAELHDLTGILRDGSVLPPIPIPPEVDQAQLALQAIASAVAGGAR